MLLWTERPTIELDGDLPVQSRFRDVSDDAVAGARRLLASIREQLTPQLGWLANAIRLRTGGRFQSEMQALAEMAEVSWQEIAAANVSYDLTLAVGCSTVALESGDGPVLARNMDWWPEDLLARSSCLMRTSEGGRFRYAQAGWPGAVGVVTGLSAQGFAIALNAVDGPESRDLAGYPVLLHIRRVLEDAADFAEAVELLRSTRLVTSALFTVVGTENDERVVVERSTRRAELRWGEPGQPLAATNHYRRLFREPEPNSVDELFGSSCTRFDKLVQSFADEHAEDHLPDDRLLYALTDPDVILGITAQHVVARPRLSSIRLFVPTRFVQSA